MADARTDWALKFNSTTNTDDLVYDSTADNGAGDWVIGYSDRQHIKDTINANVGWWKQYPNDGVCIMNYYKSRVGTQSLINKLIQQLGNDGYDLINPTVTVSNDGIMNITPNATR